MKNRINKIIGKFMDGSMKKKPFFWKMLLLYTISFAIISLGFGIIMSVSIQGDYSEQIVRLNEKALHQSVSSCTTTLENIYNYFYIEVLESSELVELMYADEYSKDLSVSFRALNTKVMNYSNLIQSCYVINLESGFVCSTMNTYQNLAEFSDQDILVKLDMIQESPVAYSLIPRRTAYTINGVEYDKKYISLVFKKYKEGFLVVNLDYDEFADMVNYRNYNEISRAILFNKNGYVLADSGELLFGTDLSGEEYYQKLNEQMESAGTYETNINGKLCRVDYYKNQYLGISYMIITNKYIQGSNLLLIHMLVYASIAALLHLMMILLSTRRLYQPIGKLQRMASGENEGLGRRGDEFQVIENVFKEMKQTSQAYKRSNRKRVLRALIEDRDIRESALLEEIGKVQVDFNKSMFLCVNLYPDMAKGEEDEWTLLKFAMDNILKELMEDIAFVENIDFGHYVTYIINYDILHGSIIENEGTDIISQDKQNEMEPIIRILSDMTEKMMEYFHVDMACSVGSVVNNMNDISESYEKAQIAAFYQLIPEEGAILYYDMPLDNAAEEQKFPGEMAKAIQAAVKAGDKGRVRSSVHEFFNLMVHFQYYNAIRYILMLEAEIIILAVNYNIYLENSGWEVLETLRAEQRLFKMQEIFLKQCLEIAEIYKENRDNDPNKKLIVEKVKLLVEDNIRNPNFTVNSVAQEIYLSTSYLRNIFKEVMGQSLSSYIIEKRLDEICRLLQETDWSARQVADYMGFSSRSYLYTFFKNYMGITLGEYRKNGRSNLPEMEFFEDGEE